MKLSRALSSDADEDDADSEGDADASDSSDVFAREYPSELEFSVALAADLAEAKRGRLQCPMAKSPATQACRKPSSADRSEVHRLQIFSAGGTG